MLYKWGEMRVSGTRRENKDIVICIRAMSAVDEGSLSYSTPVLVPVYASAGLMAARITLTPLYDPGPFLKGALPDHITTVIPFRSYIGEILLYWRDKLRIGLAVCIFIVICSRSIQNITTESRRIYSSRK